MYTLPDSIKRVDEKNLIEGTKHNLKNFSFKLTFSFRTVKKDGMLWVWANYKYYTRYLYLNMKSGFLSLEVKGHKQPKVHRYNAKRLDDNEWHHVDLRKQRH